MIHENYLASTFFGVLTESFLFFFLSKSDLRSERNDEFPLV